MKRKLQIRDGLSIIAFSGRIKQPVQVVLAADNDRQRDNFRRFVRVQLANRRLDHFVSSSPGFDRALPLGRRFNGAFPTVNALNWDQ